MIFGFFKRGKNDKSGKDSKKRSKATCIGKVIHNFPRAKVAVIKVTKEKISIGDGILIKGHTTDFEQKIKSMQIDHCAVDSVAKGKEVAIKVKSRTRRGDKVFLAGG